MKSLTTLVLVGISCMSLPFLAHGAATSTEPLPTRSEIEAKVRSTFIEAPVMVEVALCESRFRQFTDAGNPFRGGTGNRYVGIFQISESLHTAAAAARGWDILTVDGNIAYAKYLYDKEGVRPWLGCVPSNYTGSFSGNSGNATSTSSGNNNSYSSSSTSNNSFPITRNLQFGMVSEEVFELQKILNSNGFKIVDEGPGSPGNETRRYGALTRKAVERFQCAKNIVCPNGQHIVGYGYVGPKTRAALEKLVTESS